MAVPGGDARPRPGRGGSDLLRQIVAGVVADAELAVVVPAPAPQGTVGAGGAGVVAAAGGAGPPRGCGGGDLLGQILVGVVADTELALLVVAPAPQGAVGADGARVGVPGGDAGPSSRCGGGDLLGQILVGVVTDAELARVVPAPAPQRAVGAGGAGVGAASGGDAGPSSRCGGGDLLGQILVGVVADAELAQGVVAPAPQGGVGADG